ncbi:fimbrillin family protein [Phocaeicola vulgatus]|nr:fimbrillin family protein [Phocaeicola vulgatus]MDB0864183.1 fimbrillin family protein [Phocaeicola vulgatus]MDB0868420.1 fimbrillin family protein [Phocaeicola vulgatus]MDB0885448.1 fimbrillin family protein [Phocaeicola vulgatus]MDB0889665.1 fimbrillin family protein [Phocaeicola vulgatus]
MKNILNSLFPWLAMTTLLSLQGCENEEGTAIHSRDTVSFEIDAGGARATETTFETGDAIGVYAAVRMSSAPATLKTSGNYADNKRFVWNGSQFVADGDANEIAAGYETDYYAYYPYREDMGNPLDYDFSIQGDQREGITLSDFMYAANRSGTTDKVITLAFSHRLSRLQVTYTPEAGEALSGVTIQRAKATANINLGTGTANTLGATSDIRMYNDGGTFTAVIPAQDRDADGTFLTLLFADGTKKDYTLTAKKEFLAGHTTVIPFMGKELQYTFTVSPETIGSGYSGGIYNYETVSNKYYSINGKPLPGTESPLDYTVSTTDVWITPDKAGKTIKVAENLNTAPRNGKVLFTQAESGRTYILPVQQSSATTRQTLQISTTAGNIPAAGGNKAVTAVLSTYYNDHRDPDKKENVTVSLSGTGTGFSLSGNQVLAVNNTTTNARSITVKGSYNGITSDNSLTITQDAGAKQYASWSDWSVTVSANPETVANTGGTSVITADAARTRAWTWNGVGGSGGTETDRATPSLSAAGSGFSLSGTTLTAGNNTTTSERSCTVTATHAGKSATCTVKQPAGTTDYGDWKVNISASPTTIAAAGGTSTLTCSAARDVYTNGVKTGTETATPVISGSAAGFSLSGKTVSAGNNTSTSTRSITYTATHAGKSASCTITQSAGNRQYASWSAWNVTVSANPATIAASGGTSSISAAATRTRTWTWNGVSGSGGTETDRATPSLSAAGSGFSLSGTTLTAGNNTTASERSCTVTATSNGRSAACTVRQSAGSQTTEYGNWTTGSLSVSASPSGIGSSGGTSRLSATASQSRPKYTKWNGITTGTTTEYRSVDVSSSASWSGSASGFSRSGTTVTVAANGSTSSRNCTYTASYGGKSGHVIIHQDGKPADVITYGYIFTLGAVSGDDVVSTGGTVTYSVTSQKITYTNGSETSRSNIGWSASANVSWISAGTNSATVSENPTTSDRSGTITLTQNESGRKLSITVYQDRKVSVDIN